MVKLYPAWLGLPSQVKLYLPWLALQTQKQEMDVLCPWDQEAQFSEQTFKEKVLF